MMKFVHVDMDYEHGHPHFVAKAKLDEDVWFIWTDNFNAAHEFDEAEEVDTNLHRSDTIVKIPADLAAVHFDDFRYSPL